MPKTPHHFRKSSARKPRTARQIYSTSSPPLQLAEPGAGFMDESASEHQSRPMSRGIAYRPPQSSPQITGYPDRPPYRHHLPVYALLLVANLTKPLVAIMKRFATAHIFPPHIPKAATSALPPYLPSDKNVPSALGVRGQCGHTSSHHRPAGPPHTCCPPMLADRYGQHGPLPVDRLGPAPRWQGPLTGHPKPSGPFLRRSRVEKR